MSFSDNGSGIQVLRRVSQRAAPADFMAGFHTKQGPCLCVLVGIQNNHGYGILAYSRFRWLSTTRIQTTREFRHSSRPPHWRVISGTRCTVQIRSSRIIQVISHLRCIWLRSTWIYKKEIQVSQNWSPCTPDTSQPQKKTNFLGPTIRSISTAIQHAFTKTMINVTCIAAEDLISTMHLGYQEDPPC